jgi:alkylated DNA repair dioxygenase AlkB
MNFKQLKSKALASAGVAQPSASAACAPALPIARPAGALQAEIGTLAGAVPRLDFERAKLAGVSDAWLFEDFVTEAEEAALLAAINAGTWVDIKHRRLQCWGGDPVRGARRAPLPDWLQGLAAQLRRLQVVDFEVNHCLINEYVPGQTILPHTDGPMYAPRVAGLSLGAACAFTFTARLRPEDIGRAEPRTLLSLALPPRSLLVFSGGAYADALHGVSDVDGTRVSLTLRRILC